MMLLAEGLHCSGFAGSHLRLIIDLSTAYDVSTSMCVFGASTKQAFVAVAFVNRFHRQQNALEREGVPCAVSTVWQNWLLLKWPGSALLCSWHTSSTMRGALVYGQHA